MQTPPPTSSDPQFPFPTIRTHPFDCDWQCLCSIVWSCRLWWRHIHRAEALLSVCLLYAAAELQVCKQFLCLLKMSCMGKSLGKQEHDHLAQDAPCKVDQSLALHEPDPDRPESTNRGPAGGGGSGLRNAAEVVIRFRSSSGMGTRSHSLTRHKAECVCHRVFLGGIQGRGLDERGGRPWPLYIHQQITNLAHRHARRARTHKHTHSHACKHMLMPACVRTKTALTKALEAFWTYDFAAKQPLLST